MQENITRLRVEIDAYDLSTPEQLDQFRIAYTGRKGQLADLFDQLKTVPQEQRRAVGQELNQLKQLALARFESRQQELETANATAPADPTFDYTLPAVPHALGTRHPLSLVREEIVRILARIGFNVAEGPEIEDDWHNFTALNFPENHPARDMQDTFFLANRGLGAWELGSSDDALSSNVSEDNQGPKPPSPQAPKTQYEIIYESLLAAAGGAVCFLRSDQAQRPGGHGAQAGRVFRGIC